MRIAFDDTKPHDRDDFARAEGADRFEGHCHEFGLSTGTAGPTRRAPAAWGSVNDLLDRRIWAARRSLPERLG